MEEVLFHSYLNERRACVSQGKDSEGVTSLLRQAQSQPHPGH